MAENRETAIAKRTGGTVARKEFGAEELATTGETAGSVLAAQSRAMVEARFVMALRNPRDWDDVRQKLLRACERPGFAGSKDPKADKWGAAWYKKPVGEGVEGFSIRFAEEAMRCMGNLDVQTMTIYDDDFKRLITVVVTDLEGNNSFPTSIVIEKTVERRKAKDGDEVLRTRLNSYGDTVFIVAANEDQVFQKQQSAISKAMRNGILRLLPGDIQAECRQRILEIRFGDAAKDPGKVRREVSDAFGRLNVLPSGLKQYLDHDLGEATPAELEELRDLYKAIQQGKVTWHDALAAVMAERDEEPPPAGGDEPPAKPNGGASLTDQLKAQRESRPAAPEVKAPTDQPTEPAADSSSSSESEPKEAESTGDGGMAAEDALLKEVEAKYNRGIKTPGKSRQTKEALKPFGVSTIGELQPGQLGAALDALTALLDG